jgi:hypothetical protein
MPSCHFNMSENKLSKCPPCPMAKSPLLIIRTNPFARGKKKKKKKKTLL